MHETWVRSLIWEDSTCLGATKSVLSLCSRARELQLLKPACPRTRAPQKEKPLQWEAHMLQLKRSPKMPQPEKSPNKKIKLNIKNMKVKSFSRVRLFATPWTVAYQAPLSMGFSRQEYWSGVPLPSPGELPNPGTNSPALQADTFPSEPKINQDI